MGTIYIILFPLYDIAHRSQGKLLENSGEEKKNSGIPLQTRKSSAEQNIAIIFQYNDQFY